MPTRTLALALGAFAFSGSAFAGAKCTAHPKSEWLPADAAKSRIEAQGYKIRKFKVDGQCYEIYGHDKNGKKVEIYFDTKTLEVVKAEVEH
jgi:hypothetical protein